MSKRIYISADYANEDGDKIVVDKLNAWARDNYHVVDFTDMAKVVSGSVSLNNDDCRICELKKEFNNQINLSSIIVFVVGDKTKLRTAGSMCGKAINSYFVYCTPYKQNTKGEKTCNNYSTYYGFDVNPINTYSYLRHEFEQAKKKGKKIVIFYNSTRNETAWLPSYMNGYEENAVPFWYYKGLVKEANYQLVKKVLDYE